jgi:hypothetical protein
LNFYGYSIDDPDNKARKYFLLYSAENKYKQLTEFNLAIKKVKEKLEDNEELSEYEEQYVEFLDITNNSDNKVISLNKSKITKKQESFGYYSFITSKKSMYLHKCIQSFEFKINSDIEFSKHKIIYEQFINNDYLRAKRFIYFLTSIIKTYLTQKLTKYNNEFKPSDNDQYVDLSKLSIQDLILELQSVEITNVFDKNQIFHEISKTQLSIFSLVNLSLKDVLDLAHKERKL